MLTRSSWALLVPVTDGMRRRLGAFWIPGRTRDMAWDGERLYMLSYAPQHGYRLLGLLLVRT